VRTRLRLLVLSLASLCLVASLAAAQTAGSLDAGLTRVGYSDIPGITAYSLSPALQVFSPNASLVATGVFSEFQGGGWSLQGAANGSVFIPAGSHIQAELGTALSGSAPDSGAGTAALLGQGRLHLAGARHGLWAGGALGRTWDGITWRTTALVEAAGWARLGDATLVASTSPTWIGDSLRLLDTEATIRLVRGRVELGAYGGFRTWFEPADASGTAWGGASAAYWVTDHLAIVAAGGSYPADFGQGFPGGSYVALTIRVATRRPPAPSRVESREYRLLQPLARPVVPAFQITTVSGSDRLIRTHAPGASSVEIMGDFSEWRPIPLVRGAGDDWTVVVTITKGTHRMNLRVNGGDWGVPPGVTPLNDDFGGVVGVLLVE
jgi:AMP-activated protein kinase-like protein